jgi:hypothetical protein
VHLASSGPDVKNQMAAAAPKLASTPPHQMPLRVWQSSMSETEIKGDFDLGQESGCSPLLACSLTYYLSIPCREVNTGLGHHQKHINMTPHEGIPWDPVASKVELRGPR